MSEIVRDANGHWLPGKSANPGGKLRRVRELREYALSEAESSFAIIKKIRDTESEEARVRLEAAKILLAYGMGAPPKVIEVDPTMTGTDAMAELTLEELRALARRELAMERAANEDGSKH